jgi:hypothetical protein
MGLKTPSNLCCKSRYVAYLRRLRYFFCFLLLAFARIQADRQIYLLVIVIARDIRSLIPQLSQVGFEYHQFPLSPCQHHM